MTQLNVTKGELQSILLLIRRRQDDVRKVQPEDRDYITYRTLDTNLEKLKMNLVSQANFN